MQPRLAHRMAHNPQIDRSVIRLPKKYKAQRDDVMGPGGARPRVVSMPMHREKVGAKTEPNRRTEPNRTEPNRTEPNRLFFRIFAGEGVIVPPCGGVQEFFFVYPGEK